MIRFLSFIVFFALTFQAQAVELKGYLIQGGWAQVQTKPAAKISFAGKNIQADKEGIALIAFGRDADLNQVLLVEKAGRQQEFKFEIDKKTYDIQRINGLEPKFVSPSPEAQEKIKQDRKIASQARQILLTKPFFAQGFIWPTQGWITGVYGSQRILNGKPRFPHLGIDIADKVGTPIYAPAAGKITLAEDMELSGKTLFINHGYGLMSDMMHLSEILVQPGDLVEQGQLVGKMGATGRATGSHLHWGMSWFDVRIDASLALNLPQPVKKGLRVENNRMFQDKAN